MSSTRKPRPRKSSAPDLGPGFEREADRIRWSKVMTARARIAVGHYDRDDVKQRVLDALIAELARG